MPEMDGFDATAEIRARRLRRPRQPETSAEPVRLPVIGLTASAIKGEREHFLAAGMDDYLTKPFRRDALIGILERWVLDQAAAHDETAAPAEERHAKTLDESMLEHIRRIQRPGAPSVVAGLIDSYLVDAAQLLEELSRAAEAADIATLLRAASSLRSGSVFLGASRLGQLCGELEHDARAGNSEALAHGISRIRQEYATVRAAMEAARSAS
jgi:CheY-like chemotaxis protein